MGGGFWAGFGDQFAKDQSSRQKRINDRVDRRRSYIDRVGRPLVEKRQAKVKTLTAMALYLKDRGLDPSKIKYLAKSSTQDFLSTYKLVKGNSSITPQQINEMWTISKDYKPSNKSLGTFMADTYGISSKQANPVKDQQDLGRPARKFFEAALGIDNGSADKKYGQEMALPGMTNQQVYDSSQKPAYTGDPSIGFAKFNSSTLPKKDWTMVEQNARLAVVVDGALANIEQKKNELQAKVADSNVSETDKVAYRNEVIKLGGLMKGVNTPNGRREVLTIYGAGPLARLVAQDPRYGSLAMMPSQTVQDAQMLLQNEPANQSQVQPIPTTDTGGQPAPNTFDAGRINKLLNKDQAVIAQPVQVPPEQQVPAPLLSSIAQDIQPQDTNTQIGEKVRKTLIDSLAGTALHLADIGAGSIAGSVDFARGAATGIVAPWIGGLAGFLGIKDKGFLTGMSPEERGRVLSQYSGDQFARWWALTTGGISGGGDLYREFKQKKADLVMQGLKVSDINTDKKIMGYDTSNAMSFRTAEEAMKYSQDHQFQSNDIIIIAGRLYLGSDLR